MAEINKLDLDLYPAYIPFIVQCTTAAGAKSNPTVDNLIIYEEGGADGTFDNSTIAGSPFDPVQFNAKTGSWGKMIAKSAFTAGRFYIALWEMTVDGETTAKIEVYFAVNAAQYMANVTNLDAAITSRSPASEYDTEMGRIDVDLSTRAVESDVEGHCTDALDTYDPPTRDEATADKDEIIAAYSTDQQDFNVAAD